MWPRGGVTDPLGPVWLSWVRVRSNGPRVGAVGAWPVPWAPCGPRGGVAGPIGPVCLLWGRGQPSVSRVATVGA